MIDSFIHADIIIDRKIISELMRKAIVKIKIPFAVSKSGAVINNHAGLISIYINSVCRMIERNTAN